MNYTNNFDSNWEFTYVLRKSWDETIGVAISYV